MRLRAAWHLVLDRPMTLIRVRDAHAIALGADGSLVAFDAQGELRWSAETGGARAMALGEVVVTLGRGLGERYTLTGRDIETGDVRWAKSVPARRMTRLFANGGGAIFGTLSRDGAFLLETYRESDGEAVDGLPLDRRRAMVSRDGRRVFTRDGEGLTAYDRQTGDRRYTTVDDGPMTDEEDWLVTSVDDTIVGIRQGDVVWRTATRPRDLSDVAVDDGLDEVEQDEEDDVWEPELGRPVITRGCVYVADLNGSLHSLDLDTGALRWTAESRHYPSSRRVARATRLEGGIVWPGSDEMLYLVHETNGDVIDALELPFPFEGSAERWGPLALLPCADGVRAYHVE